MASIAKLSGGRKRVDWRDDGKRLSLYVGKATSKQAQTFATRIEQLQANKTTGAAMTGELATWVAGLPDDMHVKIAKHGLLKPRQARGIWKRAHASMAASLGA